jgi:glycosyltransferase involved in cell wall biosynthesis
MRLKAQYISNLPISIKSGGWSGMNLNIYNKLRKYFEIDYLPPINPKISKIEKIISKTNQYFGLKGHFEFFSEKRLQLIAKKFYQQVDATSNFLFFHGTTPWIKCKTDKPYFAYVDATFSTYLDIYLEPCDFKQTEIQRIVAQEKQFLHNAAGIFFSSEWAKQKTIIRYQLKGNNLYNVGLGGNALPQKEMIPAPPTPSVLFVSMDFKRKGGVIAYKCFVELKKQIPQLTLQIIGDAPGKSITESDGVIYHGFIDKKTEEGLQRFDEIFRSASFLIHPTEKDMTPLIIVEAGYYSIPAIAPKNFGIPEMIQHSQTGLIVHDNAVVEYVNSLKDVLSNPEKLNNLRQRCFEFMGGNFTWDIVGKQIKQEITRIINI